jgi:hypothetical protein
MRECGINDPSYLRNLHFKRHEGWRPVTRAHHVPPRRDGLCQPLLLATICALTPHLGGGPVILLLYVDDIFLTKYENLIVESKRINQAKYVIDILKTFIIMGCNSMPTPMVKNMKLLSDTYLEKVDATMYIQMIGSLMYLTNMRPYILFAVNTLSQNMVDLRGVYLIATKQVMRYLKGTIDYGLRYVSYREIILQGFTDSDWYGSVTYRKSTYRCCFILGSTMISWFSSNKTSVVLSTSKAEYIVVCSASNEAVWIWKLLTGLFDINLEAACIWCNMTLLKVNRCRAFGAGEFPIFSS